MEKLMVTKKDTTFLDLVRQAGREQKKIAETINNLLSIQIDGSETFSVLIKNAENHAENRKGYLLGLLKVHYDTLPEEIANQQRINGIPLDWLIKLRVDEHVLNKREKISCVSDFTSETEYWKKYRRLSELICGFGYSMCFNQERFRAFYPDGIASFVSGFAVGYSQGFHCLASENGIETDTTNPIEQDVWKNWEFFLKHDISEYRLDGKFLFMYHGGFNCSGDESIPYGNNVKEVNAKVYDLLKTRCVSDFHDFDISINL